MFVVYVFVEVTLVFGRIAAMWTLECNGLLMCSLDVLRQARLEICAEITTETRILLWRLFWKFRLTAASVSLEVGAWKFFETDITFYLFMHSPMISKDSLIVTGFSTYITNL